jgi:hypothetical protein
LGRTRRPREKENEPIDPDSENLNPNEKENSLNRDRTSTEDSKNEPARAMGEKGGFYHNGRFVTMWDVIENYDTFLNPSLTAEQNIDLVAFLKSL